MAWERHIESLREAELAFRAALVNQEKALGDVHGRLSDATMQCQAKDEELQTLRMELSATKNALSADRAQLEAQILAREEAERQRSEKEAAMVAEQSRWAEQCEALASENKRLSYQVEESHATIKTLRGEMESAGQTIEQLSQELKEKEQYIAREIEQRDQHWTALHQTSEAKAAMLRGEAARERDKRQRLTHTLEALKGLLADGTVPAHNTRRRARSQSPDPALAARSSSPSTTAASQSEREEEEEGVQTRSRLRMEQDTVKKHTIPGVLNHMAPEDAPLPDSIMRPVLPPSAKTVATPKIGQLVSRGGQVKHGQYLLNHVEAPGEHVMYKGEVAPSISKKGAAVRFTGLETLTTASDITPLPTRKRKAAEPKKSGAA